MSQYDPIADFLSIQNNAGSFISVSNNRQSVSNGMFSAINGIGGRKLRLPLAALLAASALGSGVAAAKTRSGRPSTESMPAAQATDDYSLTQDPTYMGWWDKEDSSASGYQPGVADAPPPTRGSSKKASGPPVQQGGVNRNLVTGRGTFSGAELSQRVTDKQKINRARERDVDQEVALSEALADFSRSLEQAAQRVYCERYNYSPFRTDMLDPATPGLVHIRKEILGAVGNPLIKEYNLNDPLTIEQEIDGVQFAKRLVDAYGKADYALDVPTQGAPVAAAPNRVDQGNGSLSPKNLLELLRNPVSPDYGTGNLNPNYTRVPPSGNGPVNGLFTARQRGPGFIGRRADENLN